MRDNPVKKKLLAGQPVFGTFGWEFLVPGLPQIARSAGAEFLIMDMEHNGTSYEHIKAQAEMCRGIGIVPMARVATTQYQYISRALDVGCMGVMVPMVGSAEQAEYFVSCTRYPPHGRRGAAFGFTHDDYEGGDIAEKIRIANERTLVMCLIETEEGIKNVDKIAAVPGVDVLWLGHFDLTNFLGIPAQFDHPKYVKAIEKLVAAAQKHNKILACMTGSDAWSREYWDKGFRLFAMGVDAHMLQSAIRTGIGMLRSLAAEGSSEKQTQSRKAAKAVEPPRREDGKRQQPPSGRVTQKEPPRRQAKTSEPRRQDGQRQPPRRQDAKNGKSV
jgi:2-keto-3-deoxy-L-rhamnonate aldolase RhmA